MKDCPINAALQDAGKLIVIFAAIAAISVVIFTWAGVL